jgi:hypothetical protein
MIVMRAKTGAAIPRLREHLAYATKFGRWHYELTFVRAVPVYPPANPFA